MEADSWEDRRSAEIYAEIVRRGTLYRDLAARLVALAQPCEHDVVLDLATGTGIVIENVLARARSAPQLVGLDRSRAMLHVARQAIPFQEVTWLRADPAALPLVDASATLLFSSAAFWHFPRRREVLAEAARVLRPGGRLAFNLPSAQLVDEREDEILPIQVALAREGERRFGRSPEPGGPMVVCAELREDIVAAGLSLDAEETIAVRGVQQEVLDLLEVSAVGGRFYPEVDQADRRAWIVAVAGRVDPDEEIAVRWRHFLATRPVGAGKE